jgi:OCT family organic cation transporter-like MFS transporter 4/5
MNRSVNTVIYEGITLNTPQMLGNQFLNFFILSVTEVPATLLGGYLLEKFGRRWTQVFFFGCCGLACGIGAILVFYPDLSVVTVITVIVAK